MCDVLVWIIVVLPVPNVHDKVFLDQYVSSIATTMMILLLLLEICRKMLNMMSFLRKAGRAFNVGRSQRCCKRRWGCWQMLGSSVECGTWMIGCMMSREVYCTFGSWKRKLGNKQIQLLYTVQCLLVFMHVPASLPLGGCATFLTLECIKKHLCWQHFITGQRHHVPWWQQWETGSLLG